MMRYFASMMPDDTPVTLFRFDMDRFVEHVWRKGQWFPVKVIVKAMVTGSNDYDEVSEKYARAAFPGAFATKGSASSGNFGHAGRPGEIGGSATKLAPVGVVGIQDLPKTDVVSYVQAHGHHADGASLPVGVQTGPANQCYRNSTKAMWDHDELAYVEGLAWKKGQPELAILHAWNVDAAGTVVDTTLRDSPEWEYFGVPYDRKSYMQHISDTMMYGVLGGDSKSAKKVLTQGGLTKGPT